MNTTQDSRQAIVTETVSETGIRKVRTAHPCHVREGEVLKLEYSKEGTEQAYIRQLVEIVSHYPAARVSNSKSDSLFSLADFSGLGEGRSYPSRPENRVAFMTVPEGTTAEQLNAMLANYPKACVYRISSNHPVLTEEQEMAIKGGLRSKEWFADKQVLKHGPGAEDEETGESLEGKLILMNGKPQYRASFFSLQGKADEDYRNDDLADYYATPMIRAQMEELGAHAEAGQGL